MFGDECKCSANGNVRHGGYEKIGTDGGDRTSNTRLSERARKFGGKRKFSETKPRHSKLSESKYRSCHILGNWQQAEHSGPLRHPSRDSCRPEP
jgi:hypothetical protein